jgi:ferritin-like metal-binding protein YciE
MIHIDRSLRIFVSTIPAAFTSKKIHMKKMTATTPSHTIAGHDESSLHLFLEELRDVLGTEKHQLRLFPLLKKAASSLKLQNMMARSLDDVQDHISRLGQVFILMGQKPQSNPPEAILGLGRDAEEIIALTAKGSATRDAALILVAQQIEHYEIAVYGSLAQMARNLEQDEVLDLLETTLCEEKEADDLLTALAENYINVEASQE